MGPHIMEKKAYISPAMVSVALNVENMLAESGPKVTEDKADKTREMDTKSSGSWNVWSSDDE